ncbi:hypothetical protein BKA93DRAFT_719879, partial [Sparassis latifolia]
NPDVAALLPFRTRCFWGGQCDVLLDDMTSGGVERHLKAVHLHDQWNRSVRGECGWHTEGKRCGSMMAQGSFGKHVASTHLRSTAVMCDVCHKVLCRDDVLGKHKKAHCRG